MSFKDRMRHLQPKVVHLPFKQLDPDRLIPDGPAATIMILPIVRIERPEPVKPKRKRMKTPRETLTSLIRPGLRSLLVVGLISGLLAARLSAAHAQALPEYSIKLKPVQVEQIVGGIMELPKRIADPLLADLRGQIMQQEVAAAEAAKPKDKLEAAPGTDSDKAKP